MTPPPRERWFFTLELPAGVDHPGRFVARVLKYLLRTWGVKATAIHATSPDVPSATPTATQAASGTVAPIGPPSDAGERQRAAHAQGEPS